MKQKNISSTHIYGNYYITEKKLNKKLIGPFLSFSFTPTNETLFEGVYRLLPGTSLTIQNRKNGNKNIL